MNINDLFFKLNNTITNNGIYNNNKILDKHYDIESQSYIDIESQLYIEDDNELKPNTELTIQYTHNNDELKPNTEITINCIYNNNEHSIIGSGVDKDNGLEWKRISKKSNYDVFYNGRHNVSYIDVDKILCKYSDTNNYDLEKILKLYIDNNKNCELTLNQMDV